MKPTDDERVTRNGYTNFPNALFDNGLAGRIGTGAFAVYLHLITWKRNGSDVSYPAEVRIAKELGICERTVVNAIAKLLEHNLIEIVERGIGRSNNNKYRLIGFDGKGVRCSPFTTQKVQDLHHLPEEKVQDVPIKGAKCSEEKVQDLHPTSTIVQVPGTTTSSNDISPTEQQPTKSKPTKRKSQSLGLAPYSDDFLLFWEAYPRKVGKGKAWEAYQKLRNNDILPEPDDLISIIDRYKHTDQWQRDNGQFIPHPTSFLNGRMFEDEPDKIDVSSERRRRMF